MRGCNFNCNVVREGLAEVAAGKDLQELHKQALPLSGESIEGRALAGSLRRVYGTSEEAVAPGEASEAESKRRGDDEVQVI